MKKYMIAAVALMLFAGISNAQSATTKTTKLPASKETSVAKNTSKSTGAANTTTSVTPSSKKTTTNSAEMKRKHHHKKNKTAAKSGTK